MVRNIKGTQGENIASTWKQETSQEFSSDIIQGMEIRGSEETEKEAWIGGHFGVM